MSLIPVKVLHVEDDAMQQRMIAHHLKALTEYAFDITAVASEELAMECFLKAHFDLVLLDYQLAQGDGLHLLGRIRKTDPIVPIIAISGVASAEVTAQLVHAGADDYFDKRNLSSPDLAKSIRSSLRRAEAVRKQMASRTPDRLSNFTRQLADLCAEYVSKMDIDFMAKVDAMAKDMKRARISAEELQRMHEDATLQLELANGLQRGRMKLLARPLLFELLVRVHDEKRESTA